jgi:hypothetical protein
LDFHRPRAGPSLGILILAASFAARADCGGVNGTYADESVEKPNGSPMTLSSFATHQARAKIVRQEATGSQPSFGGSGQVMQRPKIVKLTDRATVMFRDELKFRYLDPSGKPLAESVSTTPRPWRCVSGRLERKFEMASGLGDVVRTEQIEQVFMAAPSGDLIFVETAAVVSGPKAPPRKTEASFKRLK